MRSILAGLLFLEMVGPLLGGGTLSAAEVVKSYDFVADEWYEIGESDVR